LKWLDSVGFNLSSGAAHPYHAEHPIAFNVMTTDRQLAYLRGIQEIVNTPQWMLEVQAEEEGWITDDQHAANAWWNSQSDDIPF
jgi:hypothetical protein